MSVRGPLPGSVGINGDREPCLATGMDDDVTLPIRIDMLVGTLDPVKARNEH